MLSDAYVTVSCDKCHHSENYELTSLAGGGWDERNVEGELRRNGWRIDGYQHFCETCNEEVKS